MRVIQAPEYDYSPHPNDISVFLAGGISNTWDWQSHAINIIGLRGLSNLVLINPRRKEYIDNDDEAERQIKWEHRHLRIVDIVLFWFPCETLCPITLLEYGKCLVGNKKLIVGTHPDYKRKLDVQIQTELERPFQFIYNNLDIMCEQVKY